MESSSNKRQNKKKIGHDPINNMKNIGKSMCYLLRHEGEKYGLKIESSGFVKLEDLLNCPQIKKLRVTEEIVKEIVSADEKGRYELVNRPPLYIRAVQGHSIKAVKEEEILDQLSNIFDYPTVVHGTYYEAWKIIKETGLNRMSRNCIHFSIGHKKEDHVISGMRHNCEVFIEINAIQAFYNQIKFFISKNKVILTPGLDGVLHPNYFKKVIDHKQNILYSQPYKFAIILDTKIGDKSFYISQIHIIDISSKDIIETTRNENKLTAEFLNEFSESFIKEERVKNPFVILIEDKKEESYVNNIINNCNDLNHLSFYCEYVSTNKNLEMKEENLISIYSNLENLSASDSKKIAIDLKVKLTKNKSKLEEEKKTENISPSHDNTTQNFHLTKGYLKDKSKEKNYILMFLNFEEEDILTSIDSILIKKDGEKIIPSRFVLETKPIKKNLTNFLENLKEVLKKENVFTKLLILCINKEDLDYLKDKMKKCTLKMPNIFLRNIIIIKQSDFSCLEQSEYYQAAELFLLQYIIDDDGIDKIKIIL